MSTGFASIDFGEFHRSELPRRMAAGDGELVARAARSAGALAFRIQETGESYTYAPGDASIDVRAGDADARTVVELPREAWEGLVHDLETPPALIYAQRAKGLRGSLMDFVQWEPLLRALYTGRPLYDPDTLSLRGRDGAPLDPTHAFHRGDDPEEMAHFLREVGYVFVKALFSPEEVRGFRAAADALRARARPGDQTSWWGRDDRGQEVLCRVIRAGVEPALAGLPSDRRILDLVDLGDVPMESHAPGDLDGVSVLWKNPRMSEGLSDLPWHRDCGMGGHASRCPTMVGSVFLSENRPEAGALRFLPGSWQKSYRFADAEDANALEGVLIPAEPGDFTLHYGDGWHAAPPPTSEEGPFRSCVLVGFSRKGGFNHRGERHYNDVLLGDEQGQVTHLKKVASDA